MKRIIYLIVVVCMVVFVAGCGSSEHATNGRVQVVTSFNAVTELVQAVGGDYVDVHTIIPDGTEPHDFELKAEDIKKIAEGQVFVYQGLGMEPWVDQALEAANRDDLIVVEAGHEISPIRLDEDEVARSEEAHHDQENHKEDGSVEGHHGHHHGLVDPHAWLSLRNAMIEIGTIRDALVKADPNHADYYQDRAEKYIGELQKLDQEYAQKFRGVQHHHFVTGHAAFAYLCRDYGLEQYSVESVFAEGEPNAQQLADLVDISRQHHIKTIFAEEMASPQVSKTLAQEVGAKVEGLYTMESQEDGLSYLDRMRSNLEKIYQSMQ